jgi:hypothetical protein
MSPEIIPKVSFLARYGREQAPTFFDETIFQQGFDYFDQKSIFNLCYYFSTICLTLTLMKEKTSAFSGRPGYSVKDYVDLMKKMSPRDVRKLFAKTRAELIVALELIIKRVFRTTVPCVVDVRKGVLLVNRANKDEDTLRRLAKRGVPIFSQLTIRDDICFLKEEIDFVVRNIIKPLDFPGGEGYYNQSSYFFLKNGRVYAHLRKSNKEVLIG